MFKANLYWKIEFSASGSEVITAAGLVVSLDIVVPTRWECPVVEEKVALGISLCPSSNPQSLVHFRLP